MEQPRPSWAPLDLPRRERLRQAAGQTWELLRRTPRWSPPWRCWPWGCCYPSQVLMKGLRRGNDTITVTGASTERIVSDNVDWSVEVRQSGPNQPEAYRGLQPSVQRAVAFLKAQGIKPEELELEAVKSEKEDVRDPRTGELRSTIWTARQSILVNSSDVQKIHTIAGQIGQLIGEGIPLSINPPAYTYTKLAEKRVDMLAKATRDARNRARAIAGEAGAGIGPMTNADTGTFQVTAPNSTETSGSGSYDTTTINKDITAVMAVSFRLD